jgi:hypothetical protein
VNPLLQEGACRLITILVQPGGGSVTPDPPPLKASRAGNDKSDENSEEKSDEKSEGKNEGENAGEKEGTHTDVGGGLLFGTMNLYYAAAERALAQVLSLLALLVEKHSIYLLYWYKSTIADAADERCCARLRSMPRTLAWQTLVGACVRCSWSIGEHKRRRQVLSLLALLVEKYNYGACVRCSWSIGEHKRRRQVLSLLALLVEKYNH